MCIKEYFDFRQFPCTVTKDPTSDEIFNVISEAQAKANISCLIVFVMSHGEKGLVEVNGTPGYVPVQDIITQMCRGIEDKPKVSWRLQMLQMFKLF